MPESSDAISEIINDIQLAFKDVAPLLLQHAGRIDFTTKADDSPLTTLDIEVERRVTEVIKAKHKDILIYGEESGYGEEVLHGKCWIIDPIDGTKSFIENTGTFTNMALYLVEGQAMACVVYNPTTEVMYYAIKGLGAFKNGMKLDLLQVPVSNRIYCKQSNIARLAPLLATHGLECASTPVGAGHYFSQVAEGVSSGVICINGKGYIHDYATGALLVEEAGGYLTPLLDNNFTVSCKNFVAYHPSIAPAIRHQLASIKNLARS